MTENLSQTLRRSPCQVVVLGAGLAGSECAWQLAEQGIRVALIEQRPLRKSEAHKTGLFAELVCSNSLKSKDPTSAPGLLKAELEKLKSLVLRAAEKNAVPAGQALAVEREGFSSYITKKIETHPLIEVLRFPVEHYEELIQSGPSGLKPVVIATGPLTGESLAKSLSGLIGERLYFYDAIAPIIAGDSINKSIAFLQNRHDKGTVEGEEGDYLNCPMTRDQYFEFIEALKNAEKVEPNKTEKLLYFQGCQPIEALLERGDMTLAFGPMKPVGLENPHSDQRPFAVVQLRKEDTEGRSWNMVGFQTKLKYPEQKKVFSKIPGLESAEFYRYGSIHRNTYIHSPVLLDNNFRLKQLPAIHFAGQITGVEGYLESTAIGALVGRMIALRIKSNMDLAPPPPATTALGALASAIVNGKVKNFQPMNINWGLVPLQGIDERDKDKKTKLVTRAQRHFDHWKVLF